MDAKTNIKTATLVIGDPSWSFPIYKVTIGPEVIDISKLYNVSGRFTYYPGSRVSEFLELRPLYAAGR